MKILPPSAAAVQLTTVRPLRTPKVIEARVFSFDIVAILDPFSIQNPSPGADNPARNSWLRHHLPEAFADARILAFGYVDQPSHKSKSVVDNEAFDFEFLNQLLQLRRTTNTVCFAGPHISA